ncbi:MAG: GNAT family N-acetyltransferase [Chloroflexi bacterium]|nr:GNAT family N-acetyltransferase [Chloroflexota bacterium]
MTVGSHQDQDALIRIRQARPDEAEALGALGLRSKAHWGYSADFMAACRPDFTFGPAFFEREHVIVIESGGRLCGFYSLDQIRAATAELTNLFIDPDAIGGGYGRRLWDHALETARSWGCTRLEVDADPNAAAFYVRMGAQQFAESASTTWPGRKLPRLAIDLTAPPNRG